MQSVMRPLKFSFWHFFEAAISKSSVATGRGIVHVYTRLLVWPCICVYWLNCKLVCKTVHPYCAPACTFFALQSGVHSDPKSQWNSVLGLRAHWDPKLALNATVQRTNSYVQWKMRCEEICGLSHSQLKSDWRWFWGEGSLCIAGWQQWPVRVNDGNASKTETSSPAIMLDHSLGIADPGNLWHLPWISMGSTLPKPKPMKKGNEGRERSTGKKEKNN